MAIQFNLAFCRRIAVFAVFLHLVLALGCPSGWDGYGNSCYKFVIQSSSMRGLNWDNARRVCLGYGGDLVSIANQSEMSFVYNKSSKVWNQHYWIGLNDRHNENQFVWSDGAPYNTSVYSNWYPGEPNDRAGEDCVELYLTHWNDNNCNKEYGYICEKSKDHPPLYETIGCFQDQKGRAIPSIEGQDAILDGRYEARLDSIEKCYRAAKKRGFNIFAVQNGGWCASSATAAKTFNKYGKSSACKSDGKGGPWANQVYYITDYDAVGCYKDTGSRAIPTLEGKDSILDGSYSSRTNPIAKCAVAAMRAGYSMFAVQNGGWCVASASAPQTYDKYGKSTACKDDGEGGPGANQVYELKGPPLFNVTSVTPPETPGSCNDLDLGIGSGSISDSKITASSVQSARTPAKNGRVNYTAGSSWCPEASDPSPYLQIDLQTLHIICAVSTQGNSQVDEWVETYTLQSSKDGLLWTDYKAGACQVQLFQGNYDRNSEVKHVLVDGVLAKYLRFLPKTHHNSICMRTEVFGVKLEPENLALGKPAAQSSTYGDVHASGEAEKAVDGNPDADFNHGHCSHTNPNNPGWWRVDLGPNGVPVSEVSIVNRFSADPVVRLRSKDYKITMGDNADVTRNPQCMGLYSFIQFKASALCFTNPLTTGRYVGIMTTVAKQEWLTLCEVEIYSRENLAFGKQTAQMSTIFALVSSRAVDGNSNTSLNAGSSCASTQGEHQPWWRVDLGRDEPVSELYIVNRGDCCGARLENFEIRVGSMSTDGGVANPRCGGIHGVPQGEGKSFYCRPYLNGRYVTIRSLKTSELLTLCEVEVYSARRACQIQAIGVASRYTIPDSSFSASSTNDSDAPSKGRLNGQGAWSPINDNNANDYLEIDLLYEFLICAVATQGKSTDGHWTTKYKLLTSLNNKNWVTYQENNMDKVFNGNSGRNDIVKHNLQEVKSARFIRFQPTHFSTRKALRVEVFGVLKPAVPSQAPILFTVMSINSTTIKASWQLSPADSKRQIIKGFKLFYKRKDVVGLPTEITMKGSAIRIHYATGLDENTEYEFQVLAFSHAGDGPKSAVKFQRTIAAVPPKIMKDVLPTSVICEKDTVCCLCCYATSDSPVSYSWTKNGQDPINDIKVINNNIVLTPRSAEDYGLYVCNASNSFGSTSYEITLIEDRKSSTKATTKGDDSFSNIYLVIVIALSCLVLVLLTAVSLLTWRLRRAVNNKRERTPQKDTSDEAQQQYTTRDQHEPEELSYMELKPGPLEEPPHSTQNYQSLQGANTSSAYCNVGFNRGNNNQEDEVYYEIGNAQC